MSDEIPQAALKIECAMVNPPKPVSCAVLVDGKLIAVVALSELRDAAARAEALEREYVASRKGRG